MTRTYINQGKFPDFWTGGGTGIAWSGDVWGWGKDDRDGAKSRRGVQHSFCKFSALIFAVPRARGTAKPGSCRRQHLLYFRVHQRRHGSGILR